jgi:hypothetical protein
MGIGMTKRVALSCWLFGVAGCAAGPTDDEAPSAAASEALIVAECPPRIVIEASDFALYPNDQLDLSAVTYDCNTEAARGDEANPCIAYYTTEVHEVASEVRDQARIPATLSQVSAPLGTCRYAAPETVRGRVNAVEIKVDHGQMVVRTAYTPKRPRTFGAVWVSAYPSRVAVTGVEFAPDTRATVTHATGPYSYSYVKLGTAKIGSATVR